MTKYERVKLWAKTHEEAIIAVSIGTIVVALVVVGVKAEMAYQERVSTELNYAIDQLNALYRAQLV